MLRKRWIMPLIVFLLLMAISPVFAGGWSVATLDELPEQVVVGEPLEISFVVRQHGVRLLTDLEPVVVIIHEETGNTTVFETEEAEPGHYVAELTFRKAGVWNWEISAFGPDQPMPPLTVLAEDDTLVAAEADDDTPAVCAERGAALFVAKGCVACHQHDEAIFDEYASINEGPELTAYDGDEEFLHAWLKNPSAVNPKAYMPNLELSENEIEALIAFLNADDEVEMATSCSDEAESVASK